MNKFVQIIFFSLLWSQESKLIPFDWGGQFGYVNKNGKIMWNEDWKSNRLLFDGTWSIYPRMFGPEIESGFLNPNPDPDSNIDSSLVTSYFKYDQGDYVLDRFSLGADYAGKGRHVQIHAFKRSYAGLFGQYVTGSIQPIQQSYTASYESNKGLDEAGVSLGHFNTFSGMADTTSRGLINNHITTANTFWNRSLGQFKSKLSIDQFLQRYQANHSLSEFTGVRYLTRSRVMAELIWKDNLTFGVKKNTRNVRMDSLITTQWNRYYLKGQFSILNLDIGMKSINKKMNLDYSLGMEYQLKSFLFNAGVGKNANPIHPYYLFHKYSETISSVTSISNYYTGIRWNGNESKASVNLSNLSDKNAYWDSVIPDSGNYLWDKNEHQQFNINYQTSWLPFVDFEIKYATQNLKNLYGGGIGDFLNYNLKSKLSLFDGFMLVDLKLGIDRYMNRLNNSNIHPIEMVPMIVYTNEKMDNITLLNGSITAYVSTFTIKYEWLNISEMIFASMGSEQNNFFEIHPEMPQLGQQANLSVEWHFLD